MDGTGGKGGKIVGPASGTNMEVSGRKGGLLSILPGDFRLSTSTVSVLVLVLLAMLWTSCLAVFCSIISATKVAAV